MRIAIVNADKCKPNKCQQECKKACPVVRLGKMCIDVNKLSKTAIFSEPMCIGCGLCVKKCPFEAVSIINLPINLNVDTIHRYGPNTFKLHRLPIPHAANVVGLVGCNGIGKSTALSILSGELKPNFGNFQNPPDWNEIITSHRGSQLQSYFKKILENQLKSILKPQYIDRIPKTIKGTVVELLRKYDESNKLDDILEEFDLLHVKDRDIENLSGGELQRFACAMTCITEKDVYMFDEPSSYLDVKQRIKMANSIRNMVKDERYIFLVEHDLSILDYTSDYVCCLYGSATHYGVVTRPASVREGINHYLDGFIPSANMRFRDTTITFHTIENTDEDEDIKRMFSYKYPSMEKSYENFNLKINQGSFSDSEIVVLLGENGSGKTSFIRILAGNLQPDDEKVQIPSLNVSYKPQKISPKFEGSVQELLMARIRDAVVHPQFISDVMKPLDIKNIIDLQVKNLSGGELQRVALTICLGKPADVYLIDEPSAHLDVEQRLNAARVIKRFIRNTKKTAFVVEHDFIMATYLADRVIVFDGQASKKTNASSPQPLLNGLNLFLKSLDVTFRRDKTNGRPRINRNGSLKDVEQKRSGNYFFLE